MIIPLLQIHLWNLNIGPYMLLLHSVLSGDGSGGWDLVLGVLVFVVVTMVVEVAWVIIFVLYIGLISM